MTARQKCPSCGTAMVPIAYGFPGPDTIRDAERGEVHIGGCIVGPDMPTHHCRQCATDHGGGSRRRWLRILTALIRRRG